MANQEKAPKGIEYMASFEPDMDRMVKALRILYEYQPKKADIDSDYASKELLEKAG